MEEGYYPTFEKTHIQFGLDDNIAVVEYEERVVSVRLFFSIDEEAYELYELAKKEAKKENVS